MPLDVLVERDGADSSMGVGPNPLRIPGIIDEALVAMRQMGKRSASTSGTNTNHDF